MTTAILDDIAEDVVKSLGFSERILDEVRLLCDNNTLSAYTVKDSPAVKGAFTATLTFKPTTPAEQ